MDSEKWLKKIPNHIGWYIAGFVDGEGSFNVSVKKRDDFTSGYGLDPSFNVSQKDRVILSLIKRYLGCGRIRQRKDGLLMYEVRNINALYEKVLPFFKKFHFLSASKKKNFSVFSRIIKMIYQKKHLTNEGLWKILALRKELNKSRGRKRKYTLKNIKLKIN